MSREVVGNKCQARPPFRGLRVSVVGTRHEMEEIRRNTAELDKPAGFVLLRVRNEGKRRTRTWHRVVDGHRPERCVFRRTSSCLLAHRNR